MSEGLRRKVEIGKRAIFVAMALGALAVGIVRDSGAPRTVQNHAPGNTTGEIYGPDIVAAQNTLAKQIADGKPVTVLEGAVMCDVGKGGLKMIINPPVVKVDGHDMIAALSVDDSQTGIRAQLLGLDNPGAPTTELPACTIAQHPTDPDAAGTRITVVLGGRNGLGAKGGPFTAYYFSPKTGVGQEVLSPYGDEMPVGMLSSDTTVNP